MHIPVNKEKEEEKEKVTTSPLKRKMEERKALLERKKIQEYTTFCLNRCQSGKLPQYCFLRVIEFKEKKNIFRRFFWGRNRNVILNNSSISKTVCFVTFDQLVSDFQSMNRPQQLNLAEGQYYRSTLYFQKQFQFSIVCLVRCLSYLSNLQ